MAYFVIPTYDCTGLSHNSTVSINSIIQTVQNAGNAYLYHHGQELNDAVQTTCKVPVSSSSIFNLPFCVSYIKNNISVTGPLPTMSSSTKDVDNGCFAWKTTVAALQNKLDYITSGFKKKCTNQHITYADLKQFIQQYFYNLCCICAQTYCTDISNNSSKKYEQKFGLTNNYYDTLDEYIASTNSMLSKNTATITNSCVTQMINSLMSFNAHAEIQYISEMQTDSTYSSCTAKATVKGSESNSGGETFDEEQSQKNISTLLKCGILTKAKTTSDWIPGTNIATWSAIISIVESNATYTASTTTQLIYP